MTDHRIAPAYLASFRMGIVSTINDRPDLISRLIIYAVLLLIFWSIFNIMPMEQLNAPQITARHLLWYFAMTETITVSAQGFRRELGKTIAGGQITTLMQRPGRMLFMTMARVFGGYVAQALLMLAITLIVLSLAGLPIPISLTRLPILVITLMLAGLISMLLGYLSGMFEIFGPYSLPIDWAMHKFIMALGGLFFPVIFFPTLVRQLVMLTPFPAILYVPGSIMIGATNEAMAKGILLQIFWLIIIGGSAIILENKLIDRVMQRGD